MMIGKRKKAKQAAEATSTTTSTPRLGPETAPAPAQKPGIARSPYMNQKATTSSGTKGAIRASSANKGGRRTSGSGGMGKAMSSWAKAKPCKKGSKRCGPNK